MCVQYVSFGSTLKPKTFGWVAMSSAVLVILRSRLLVYSAGSRVNRVQVVLSGFIVRLLCFVQTKTGYRVWLYVFRACVCGCDGDVIRVGHDLNRCSVWC